MAEISPIKFGKMLNKNLFPDNAFYKNSKTDEANYKTIQIPEAGTTGTAKVGDYPSLPLTISKRTDSVKSYTTDEIYIEPKLIEREDEILLSYSKQADIISDMAQIINTTAADIAASAWAPTSTVLGNVFPTTGTATRTPSLVGATGTRKQIVMADLLNVRNYFNKTNLVEGDQVYGLLTPDQINDLFEISQLVDYDKTGELTKLRNGEIGTILGMKLMMRWNDTLGSNGVFYSTTGVKKALGAAVVATDAAAAIFWKNSMVRHAEGFASMQINRNAPGYKGGTIIEAQVRFGATISRTDEKGVAAIYEAS